MLNFTYIGEYINHKQHWYYLQLQIQPTEKKLVKNINTHIKANRKEGCGMNKQKCFLYPRVNIFYFKLASQVVNI